MNRFSSLSGKIEQIRRDIENREDFAEEEPTVQCPHCDGYGNIIDQDGARLCSCVKKEILHSEFERALIPKRYLSEDLETFRAKTKEMQELKIRFQNYIANYRNEPGFGKGYFLCGPAGTGKTHLAIGILKGLLQKGHSGVFFNIVDLIDSIRATYDPNNQQSNKYGLDEQLNRQILVLDDFGVQKTTDWVIDRLYSIINKRYQDYKTLIITSNNSIQEFVKHKKAYPRIMSRLIDMCEQVEIAGDDHRRENSRLFKPSPARHRKTKSL